jgi:iron complex outermembrane receptor protein
MARKAPQKGNAMVQHDRFKTRLLRSAATGIVFSLAAAGVAEAQIETVVVTAEKRAENIQSVPIAITAFTAADLQTKNITDLHGLSNLTPNVNLDGGSPFSGDSSVLSASIRGIGQDDFAFNLDPGVGVYLDGVYLARTIGSNVDLLDVERIEILKGPQGTLFGRNTIGGAISIVTRNPGETPMIEAQVTTGSFNRRDINVTADFPLESDLLSSLTVSSVQRDGYQKVIPYNNVNHYTFDPISPDSAYESSGGTSPTNNEFGGQNRQAVRGKLLWTPSSAFTVTMVADWTHQDQEATPNTVRATYIPPLPPAAPFQPNLGPPFGLFAFFYDDLCLGGVPAPVCTTPRMTGGFQQLPGLPALSTEPTLLPISPATTQTGNIDTTYANGPNYAKFDSEGIGITENWVLDDSLSLKSITGYRHITWSIGIDLDGSADHGNFLTVTDKQQQQQFSQELQAIGTAFDSRLNYVAGLYFFYENGYVHDWVPFDGGLLAVEDSGLNLLRTQSYAAFAHADYKITDELGLTLGGRYSIDYRSFEGGQQDLNGLGYLAIPPGGVVGSCYPATVTALSQGVPVGTAYNGPNGATVTTAATTCQQFLGFPVAGQPYRYFPAGNNHQTFYEFTPTASAQYHVTDDFMAYVSWSKGFKSGGWTTRLSAPIFDAKDAEYHPEKAQTYEVGAKSEWLDHRLQANAALFYTDYTGIQLNQQVAASPVLKNLGDANIFGGELETEALIGDGFTLRANAGYIDAYYYHLDPSLGGAITLGSKLPKTPMWKINVNPQYEMELGSGRGLLFQASYTHTSSLYNDSLNTPLLKRPDLDLVDLSAEVTFNDGKYAVQVGGTNVTGRRYITEGSLNYAAGFVDASYNAPAQWYLMLRAKF